MLNLLIAEKFATVLQGKFHRGVTCHNFVLKLVCDRRFELLELLFMQLLFTQLLLLLHTGLNMGFSLIIVCLLTEVIRLFSCF